MTDLIDSQAHLIQSHKPPPHLKLVVSNQIPAQDRITSHKITPPNSEFTAEIQKRSPSLYVLVVHDSFHHLACNLMMEIVESEDRDDLYPISVICQFPPIADGKLTHFIDDDEDLLSMILIEFHMKILEQVLLFCIAQDASTLVIQADDNWQDNALGICQEIVVYEDKVPTKTGALMHLIIPADSKTFNRWGNFMGKVKDNFLQTLWHEKAVNPAMRQYLKARAFVYN